MGPCCRRATGCGERSSLQQNQVLRDLPVPNEQTGLTPALRQKIADLAVQIETHRAERHALHPGLTLTGLYNVLEKVRAGEALGVTDRSVHDEGLVSVLLQLHRELDQVVTEAYGITSTQAEEEDAVLERLLGLNLRRAAEEKDGKVQYLRPEVRAVAVQEQESLEVDEVAGSSPVVAPIKVKLAWPSDLPSQIRAVADTLGRSTTPLSLDLLAAGFSGRGRWKERLPTILESFQALGRAREREGGWQAM